MIKASEILFSTNYNGAVLFKKQSDIVQDLLNNPNSHYYTSREQTDKYEKEFIRLKTLISQLLSPTVTRNIPPEFPESLKVVVSQKVNDFNLAESIVSNIIADLKIKNEYSRIDARGVPSAERLKSDFKAASYIAIITANPLEIESDTFKEGFSLRKLFIEDFLSKIHLEDFGDKKYRLLLPLEPSCHLFWKGLKEIVSNYIKKNRNNNNLIASLSSIFQTDSIQTSLFTWESPSDQNIEELTILLLTKLNNQGRLVVFFHTSPLFSLPIIAINPADLKRSKIYALLDGEKDDTHIHSYSMNETIMWRFFVWDRIKTKQYSGKRIDFVTALNDVADF